MIRFAVAVTGVELALTILASIWVGLEGSSEPYLSESELRELGFVLEKYQTQRLVRFGSVYSYETRFVLPQEGLNVTLSVRPGTPRFEYEARLASERRPRMKDESPGPLVSLDPWEGEEGYALRHPGPPTVRAELVRWRKGVLMLVRASRAGGPVQHSEELARGERLARLVQERGLEKFGWRD